MATLSARFPLIYWSNNACKPLVLKDLRPLGSVVEHSLHTRGVRSSNLLAGTNIFKLRATLQLLASPVFRWTHGLP